MVEQHSLRELKSMLESVRHRIELLETSTPVPARGKDKELHKRLRKAKIEESVILAKLSEMGLNE